MLSSMRLAIVGVVGLLLSAGCAHKRITHPNATLPDKFRVETLNRTQYEVLGRASGSGESHFVGLWPLPFWWVETDDDGFVFWGGQPARHARHIARQRAVDSFAKADDVLEPTVRVWRRFNPWDARVKITVTGKAISVKTDKECVETSGNCWESLKWGGKISVIADDVGQR